MSSFLKTLALAALAYFSPVFPFLIAVGILISCDLISGLYRAIKNKQKITSRKMSNTITKIISYTVAIVAVFAFQKHLLGVDLHLIAIVATYIGIIELKSIDENLTSINGFSFFDKIIKIIKRNENLDKI